MNHVENISVQSAEGGLIVSIKVVPGASRDKIAGVLGDALKITTSAPPEKGKANKAIAATLAKTLGVSKTAVSLHAGPTNPRKEFLIRGLDEEQFIEILRKL